MTNRSYADAIAHPDKFYIGGSWVQPSSDGTIDVLVPSTEDLFIRVAEAQAEDIERAVASAREAFDHGPWPRMSHAERAGYLREISKQFGSRTGELSGIWTSEMGIVRGISDMMVPFVGGLYDYYASLADTFAFEERRQTPQANLGLIVREPVGVVAAILAWNAPVLFIALKIAPALLAGCTVILKASPEAPGAAYVMAAIMEAAGLPKGVVNVVTADREVSELLVRHPGVDKVTFTGSSAAGKKIAAICGERVARCTLELGGKSAAVILDDFDLQLAAESISDAARVMTGQMCSSLTRIIVSRDRHDDLVEAMSDSFSRIKVGDPFERTTEMGPLATSRQRSRVERYIEQGKAEGAVLATGGGRPRQLNRGYFVDAFSFHLVHNEMTVLHVVAQGRWPPENPPSTKSASTRSSLRPLAKRYKRDKTRSARRAS